MLKVSFLQSLENLVVAMESEAQVIDISRVSGFMQKVRSVYLLVASGSRLNATSAGPEWCDISYVLGAASWMHGYIWYHVWSRSCSLS